MRKNKPQVVFLMETKQKQKYMERKRQALQFDEAWYVVPIGKSGGLALWWKKEVAINIISSSKNIIHTKVESNNPTFPAFITFVYGPPVECERMLIWNQLRRIAQGMSSSWLYVGDFNELLSQQEKLGGNPHAFRRILNF